MKRVLLRATSGQRQAATREAQALVADAQKSLTPTVLAEVYYYVACSFAQNSTHADDARGAEVDICEALKWLGKAVEIDRQWVDVAQVDVDFLPVMRHEKFQSFLDAVKALPHLIERIAPTPDVDHEPSSTQ
jgi:hypothetical protein